MNKRDPLDQSDLGHSEDEKILSALMKKSLDGDTESYRLFLQKVKTLMVPFIANTLSKFGLSYAGGHDDVLQEILMGIHSKRSTFDKDHYVLPWMYAIAKYKTIDYLRKNKNLFRSETIDDSMDEIEAFSLKGSNGELEAGLDVETLCRSLPEKQRELLLLVKVQGLSINEAAQQTGYSVSDIKVTIHRAIKELKKKIEDSDHEHR